jgi:hypothetical protein
MLGQAVTRVDLAPDETGLNANWRYGPADRDIGHAAYATEPHVFRGVGLRPLSPVHVRGVRNHSGDLAISWIRRTRRGGDSWDMAEVPLAEDWERYEIDVLDGDVVRRTLTAGEPFVSYGADQQIADFGEMPESVLVRIYQLSAVWGRGAPRTAII